MKDILLIGVQGSGKGTQSTRLVKYFGSKINYFETGNVLRALKLNSNALGLYINETIDQGKLVDDGFIMILIRAYLYILEKDQKILLDGFPRNMSQLYLFIDEMKKIKRDFISIFLNLSQTQAINRLSSRRVCRKCSTTFNLNLDGDIQRCFECGSKLFHRNDDQPNAIKNRIEIFNKETLPVIDFFKSNGLLYEIDASKNPDVVFSDILSVIKSN